MSNSFNPKDVKIAVIGLGYVGLPLATEFSKIFSTFGLDKNKERIKELKNHVDKTLEVTKQSLIESSVFFTTDRKDIANCNVFIITVPTPVDENNNPDMSPLESASRLVGKILKEGDVVIYESTVYPGATEEFAIPILEKESGLIFNLNFFCGYSPERINPGDKEHTLTRITKITSGSNKETADFVDKLYKSIIKAGTFKATSIAVAEAAKVIENIQRDVNIALINELAILFNKLNLDTNDILTASGTKWNFLPFKPGLVGGHCIGVDPYYLTFKAQQLNYNPEMILAGRRINDSMGNYIAETTVIQLKKAGVNPVKSKVAVFGITFKENCPDIRNTKVPEIINQLKNYGCEVLVTDVFADFQETKNKLNINLISKSDISNCDAVVLTVSHNEYKEMSSKSWQKFFKKKGVFIDVKSIFSKDYFINNQIDYWRL